MVSESSEDAGALAASESSGTQKRTRSTIEFPYSDLESAIEIAQTINNRAGASCEVEQLAGWLNQSPRGGTFRSRLSAARIFGLVETERGHGRVSLKDLGRDVIDTIKGPGARVAAFLTVPLYNEMYERYKSYSLPPAAAIERQMVSLGVSSKQADRARQAFTKSAQQAGFIDDQTGRFIKPGISAPAPRGGEADDNNDGDKGGGGGGEPPKIDPIIQGLINRLPPAGDIWPKSNRKLWLGILENSFDLVYRDERDAGTPLLPKPDDEEPAE